MKDARHCGRDKKRSESPGSGNSERPAAAAPVSRGRDGAARHLRLHPAAAGRNGNSLAGLRGRTAGKNDRGLPDRRLSPDGAGHGPYGSHRQGRTLYSPAGGHGRPAHPGRKPPSLPVPRNLFSHVRPRQPCRHAAGCGPEISPSAFFF